MWLEVDSASASFFGGSRSVVWLSFASIVTEEVRAIASFPLFVFRLKENFGLLADAERNSSTDCSMDFRNYSILRFSRKYTIITKDTTYILILPLVIRRQIHPSIDEVFTQLGDIESEIVHSVDC